MTVQEAIRRAEQILPGTPAPEGEQDPRWQAIIAVGDFIESDPLAVWEFTSKWGRHANTDLRMAISTCLLEHLLEYHFDLIFPKVQEAVRKSKRFAGTFRICWRFGQAADASNAKRLDRLARDCGA